jgi:hypothetical protein
VDKNVEKSDFCGGVIWFWIERLGSKPTCETNRFGFTCDCLGYSQSLKEAFLMLKKLLSAVVLLGFGLGTYISFQPAKPTDLVSPLTLWVVKKVAKPKIVKPAKKVNNMVSPVGYWVVRRKPA